MPLGFFTKSLKEGFSIQFPVIGETPFLWDQNRNGDLLLIKSVEELKNHNILLRPSEILSNCFELKFRAIDGGWFKEKLSFNQTKNSDVINGSVKSKEILIIKTAKKAH